MSKFLISHAITKSTSPGKLQITNTRTRFVFIVEQISLNLNDSRTTTIRLFKLKLENEIR